VLPSMLVFLTFTNTIANMSNCFVDIPQAVWTLLAVICLEESLSKGRKRLALGAGMFAGMAMQTKIFGVLVLPVLLFQIFVSRRKTAAKPLLAYCLAVFLPAVLLGLPWYVKSFLYNGTILAIGHETIQGQGLGLPMGISVSSPIQYWIVDVVARILSAPWTFSLFVHQHQADTFGPLTITVLPFLLFLNVPAAVRALLAYAGVFFAGVLCMEIWFIPGGSSIRYSTFILLIAAPLIVWTVSRLADHPRVRNLLVMAVVCMVALGAALFIKRYHAEWKALAAMESRDAYYSSVLPEYPVIRAVNAIRDGSTVMATYNYVNYLIDVPYIAAYRHYASDDEAIADIRQKNIRYIFANDKFDTLANRNVFPPSLPTQCVASANGYYLFKLLW
jgi:4-amino-4-deoxy-L-arabinose transferase-like glycosyltransferase